MAYTQIMGGGNYRKWSDWKEGEYVEGTIVNRTPDQFGGMSVVLKVAENNINVTPGQQITLNNCGAFRQVDEQLVRGTKIKVVYQGKDVMSKGKFKGKEFNKVDVFVDDSTIPTTSNESQEDTSSL